MGFKFHQEMLNHTIGVSLKKPYSPYIDNEDYLIETILVRAFESGRLQNQPPAVAIDYDKLTESW
ncbi:DUF4294 domain-containing protein, partial [Flavobacterium restrictum]